MNTAPQTASPSSDHRIGVTILTGFLGSGKTTLLNRLVREPAFADAAVVVNEMGEIGVDHHLLRHAPGRIALVEGGCICCSVSGDLVTTLRELFMLALRRQIPRFRHVVIETTGLATPAPILFTLRHEAFLAERYTHRGTMVVVDTKHVVAQLASRPESVQQIAAADIIVCAKGDLVAPGALESAMQSVRAINAGAAMAVQRPDEPLAPELLRPEHSAAVSTQSLQRWLAGSLSSVARPHSDVRQITLELVNPLTRSAFVTGMATVQQAHHESLLRLKGMIGFAGEDRPHAIHGVHRDLYPLEPLVGWPEGRRRSWLVCIVRRSDADRVLAALRAVLCQPA